MLPPHDSLEHTNSAEMLWEDFDALKNGERVRYKTLRNQVQRMTKQLRRKYYARKMEGLRNSNPRSWWNSVKQVNRYTSSHLNPSVE